MTEYSRQFRHDALFSIYYLERLLPQDEAWRVHAADVTQALATFAVKVTLSHATKADATTVVECLVDTGAAYSQFPRSLLASLGNTLTGERTIIYADGRRNSCR